MKTAARKKLPCETYAHPETQEIVELFFAGGPDFAIEITSTHYDGRDRLYHDTVEMAREEWVECRAVLARRGFRRVWF